MQRIGASTLFLLCYWYYYCVDMILFSSCYYLHDSMGTLEVLGGFNAGLVFEIIQSLKGWVVNHVKSRNNRLKHGLEDNK